MKRTDHSRGSDGRPAGRELTFFALEALLLAASIVLVVHFRSTTAVVFAVGAILVAGTVAAVGATGPALAEAHPRSASSPRRKPSPGDYRATSRDLFRIEEIDEDRALVEDCRTGVLVDVDIDELKALRVVTVRSPGRDGSSRRRED
jgi:hypothetical protein